MSSATPTRKRALSAEASPEFLERDAKKVRVSVTPSASTSRGDKKRRRKKKKTTPVVDYRGVERKGSVSAPLLASDDKARANGSGSQPSSPPKSTTGGSGSSEPNLERSLSTAQVERLLDPAVASSSSFSKGKERETSPTLPETPNLEAQLADLKTQLATQKKQLDNHTNVVSTLQDSLMCQICLDLMYKPYALAPCGHLVCYGCLVQWFKTPPADNPEGEMRNPMFKRKTCPHCRAVLRERPIEVFSIKEMVGILKQSGLAQGLPPHVETDDPTPAPADPWEGLFRKQPLRHGNGPPLPHFVDDEDIPGFMGTGGHFVNDGDIPEFVGAGGHANLGIYDEEDRVYRCEDCLHEIWDGVCSECGRVYTGEPVDLEDFDDDDDLMPPAFHLMHANGVMPLGMLFPDFDDEDEDLTGGDLEAFGLHFDGAREDDENESYESSFIDDDGGGPDIIDLAGSDNEAVVAGPARRAARSRNSRHTAVVDISSDEAVSEATSSSPVVLRRGVSSRRNRRVETIVDSEEDEISNSSSPPARTRRGPVPRANRRPAQSDRILFDSDEDENELGPSNQFVSPVVSDEGSEEDDGSISRPPRHLAHLMGVSDDEHSGASDDEQGEHSGASDY